jgi:hypothetical protein
MLRPPSAISASFFTGSPECSKVAVTSWPKLPRSTSGMPSWQSSAANTRSWQFMMPSAPPRQ